ncbi:hypothetical protein GPECTOR_8g14 [Gonium pectorale]|uniref:Uncharacterized protein n=1 Tax=Gonium pectorale TaxID=33097 RepID=A0A150GST2_GONPE|nr:hypothetical protein GPECTOR_8g14 [Gonium pectorale]|eukprot:KXZ52748.1 hypothetical protein GPECTOR_8g14 [Gonium pectorale]
MGHDIKKLREVDPRAVAKRLVRAEAPCTTELGALMDCMKRAGAEADSVCTKERAALAACAGRTVRMPQDVSTQKRQLARQMQSLVSSWKRFGY